MDITPSSLQAMFSGFNTLFQKAYEDEQIWWDQVATLHQSSGEQETYAWMAEIPRLREWVGDRVVNNLAAHSYTLVNKNYEDTVEIDRNKVEDDSYGVYKPVVMALGQASKVWPQDLMVTLLEDGESQLCYDGQNFFDDSHPVNLYDDSLGTQDNYFTGTPLTQANYYVVRAAMQQFKGESGKPLGIVPDTLVVPPALEKTGKEILEADIIAQEPTANTTAAGVSSVSKNTARLLVCPQLTDSNDWYLLCTKRFVKPFVFQMRRPPTLNQLTADNDENVFNRRKYVYGVDARGNAGYGLWFLAAKAEG